MATKFRLFLQKFQIASITPLVRQIGRRCFGLLGDIRGWPIQCNHAKSCTADPCCHGTTFALAAESNRLPACMSVCIDLAPARSLLFFVGYFCKNFKLLLLLCFSMESSHFWSLNSPWPPPQNVLRFLIRPPTPKIDSPKFGKKSPITRLVWQIGRRCLRLISGFGDSRFNGTVQYVVGPTLVAMATKIW